MTGRPLAPAPASEWRASRAEDLSGQFARAAAGAGGTLERSYRIGGHLLSLRFAGRALLEKFSPALDHLRVEPGGAVEHVVEVWDGDSTQTEPPPPPHGIEALPPEAYVTSRSGSWSTIYQPGPQILSTADLHCSRSWYWAAAADGLPVAECASPLREILEVWLDSLGVRLVHAAAVGYPEGGVLIVGKSGTGKSTTSLATLGSDLLFAGDDFVGLGFGPAGAPYVHSLYGGGKLETDHLARFTGLHASARSQLTIRRPNGAEKTVFYVGESYPEQLTAGFPLKAIVLPRVTPGSVTELSVATTADALRAFVSTLFAFPGVGQGALAELGRASRAVPVLRLDLGDDLERIPVVLAHALR